MMLIDLRNVRCPMNFIKAKLAIENNQQEKYFKLLLDDNEAIDNVPPSLENEGYEVIKETLLENYWEIELKNK